MIIGGQSYVSAPPAFSADGRLLLVCSGRVVSVFSTSTAMLVSELEGHEGDVTSVVVVAPPTAAATAAAKLVSNCWTAGLDGVLIYWDFVAAEALRKVHVGLPVHSMVVPNICRTSKGAEVPTPFAFVSVEDTSKPANETKALRRQIRVYDLTKGRQVSNLLAETHKPENIVASSSGELLAISNKRKLLVWSIPTKDFKADKIRKIKLHHTKSLTVLAFHPHERIVAGGDESGRILIWRGFGNAKFSGESGAKSSVDDGRDGVRGDDDADSCTTVHWHSSRVNFLNFSSDGAYLFSGGLEGAIVVWQLDTWKRRFKPRMGSPLLFFAESPDSSISCVSCANNQVYLLKMPNMEVMKSIAGIKLPISSPNLGDCHRVLSGFDYTNRRVAIPTEDYCIQLYDLIENNEVSEVQVCERNFQPVDDITLPEEELGGLITLKFWNHGSNVGHYFLSTVIYEPHSDAGISAVAFRPGRNMAVSSSFGGNFKVSCANNQVYLLKMPNMEVMKSIAGIKLPISSPNLGDCHRVLSGFDYTNRRVAIPTEDYCIQLYDLIENNEVSEVQVCERNFQPVDDITLPEEELGGLITLKFWNHGSNVGHYFLSTVIYEPHSDAGISAVAFRPGRNMAVSSSFGGNFKIWIQSESSKPNNERNNSGWRCQSVGSYKKKPMTAAAFSGDGSVLAVAAECVITLWDPDNNTLVGIIAEALSPITNLLFVGTLAFLMSLSQSSRPQVAVWNVSNLSIQWSYSLFSEAACSSPDGSAFAVLALLSCPNGAPAEQDGVLLLFNAENPKPVSSWSVKKAKGGSISFVKGDLRDGEILSLVYVNSSHEYVVFDPHKNEELVSSKHKARRIQAEESAPISYTSIYGELPKLKSTNEVSDIPFIPSDRPWETIFSGSSHVLPPLTKLCPTFLSSFLEKRTVANE